LEDAVTVVDFVNTKRSTTVDLVVEQGVDLDVPIIVATDEGEVRDFSSYTAAMQVRPYIESSDVLFELTTENDRISVDLLGITLHFANADFVGVDWLDGEYDLEVTSSTGKKERLMEGHFTIDPEVTR
jgi:hypothetical protein